MGVVKVYVGIKRKRYIKLGKDVRLIILVL